jgi:hypothetical protein
VWWRKRPRRKTPSQVKRKNLDPIQKNLDPIQKNLDPIQKGLTASERLAVARFRLPPGPVSSAARVGEQSAVV